MTIPLVQELPEDIGQLGGASNARLFYVLTVGKPDSDEYPYTVANEKITSELGRAIALPLPEILLYRHRTQVMCFSHFMSTVESGSVPPPGDSSQVTQYFNLHPSLMEGMICFDLFVCNNDRNPGNFLVEHDGQLWLIDHGNALFYRPRANIKPGVPRLISVEENLNNLFDKEYSYLTELRSWDAIDKWCERIAAIPEYFIESIIRSLPEETLTLYERDFLLEYLVRRKGQMLNIIEGNMSCFPQLPDR